MTTSAPWLPLGTWSILITPPTEEPLTLDEAKLRAGLSWMPGDPRDQLMIDHIAAARGQVEKETGLALLTQTRDVYFYVMADGMVALPGQALPLQEIVSVTPEARAVPRWGFAPTSSPRWLGGLADYPGVTAGVARVVVGWLDAADLRTREPLLLQAVGLLTAHMATAGRDAVMTGTTAELAPLGYDEAIGPYRLIWIP